jgi:hypothetical protein
MALNPYLAGFPYANSEQRVLTRQFLASSTLQLLVDWSPDLVAIIVKNAGSVNVFYGDEGSDLVHNGAILAPGDVLNIYAPIELYALTAGETSLCSILTVLKR